MDWTPIWLDARWQAEAIARVDAQLARLGRPRTGIVEQPHVRPWSTVMTVPTATGTVWFKAAGPGTSYEARLLRELADAYLEPWTAEQPRAALNETVQTALRVGAVGRAFAWQRAFSGVPPDVHGEYAGAVGEWLLELFEPTVI